MKLISKKGEDGPVELKLDFLEDPWHLYHILHPGDYLECKTSRRPMQCLSKNRTHSKKQRILTSISICVDRYTVDLTKLELRCSGRNVKDNPCIKKGSFHTHRIRVGSNVSLYKPVWDQASIERMNLACNMAKCSVAIVLLIQHEFGCLCNITSSLTVIGHTFRVKYSKKMRKSVELRKLQLQKFYSNIYSTIVTSVDFQVIDSFIIAGPTIYKDKLLEFILSSAEKENNRAVLDNRSKFIKLPCSSGTSSAIKEIMCTNTLCDGIKDIRFHRDNDIIDHFKSVLANEPDRAFYGYSHAKYALDEGVVESLIINDDMYMSINLATRDKCSLMVASAKSSGAKVNIISSKHPPGEQLSLLGGIAIITSYALPSLDECVSEEWDAGLNAQLDNLIAELNLIQ